MGLRTIPQFQQRFCVHVRHHLQLFSIENATRGKFLKPLPALGVLGVRPVNAVEDVINFGAPNQTFERVQAPYS